MQSIEIEEEEIKNYLIQTARDFVVGCSRNRRLNFGGILVQFALIG
jgi:hypothetical protein